MKKINETKIKENVKESVGMEFSETIKRIREERKLTQKQLADIIGVSDRTISKWENGSSVPDLITIQNLCNKLDISVKSIITSEYSLSDKVNKYKRKLYTLLNYLLKNIFIIVFFTLFVLLAIYFANNYNTVNIYTLKYDGEEVNFNHGYFFQSKTVNVLTIENINVNTEIPSDAKINLELYTYRSGDAVLIYNADSLDNIYIEENISGMDILSKDVIESIKSGLLLKIKLEDENNNITELESKIILNKRYSNNKLFYSDYTNKNKKDTISLLKSSDNKLEKLGYDYNKETDTYIKDAKDTNIEYLASTGVLKYTRTSNSETYTATINSKSDTLMYNNNEDNKIKYLVSESKCIYGNCKEFKSEIDYILDVYEEIVSTL